MIIFFSGSNFGTSTLNEWKLEVWSNMKGTNHGQIKGKYQAKGIELLPQTLIF